MEYEILLAWLASDNGMVVNIAVFALLVLGGFGLPIPEDVPLIFAGVAAANEITPVYMVFAVCYVGVVISDQIIFALGYYFGNRILDLGTRSSLFPAITEERVQEIREGLKRKRFIYIFIGRHIYPVRTATFLTAGALRIPYRDFFIADMVAALVSVAVMMGIGVFLGHTLSAEVINQIAKDLHWYITALVTVMLVGYGLRKLYRRRKFAKLGKLSEQICASPCNCLEDTALARSLKKSN